MAATQRQARARRRGLEEPEDLNNNALALLLARMET